MAVGLLSEYGKQDTDQVGGKGANLGELIQNGFPIPPGFVIGADEYAAAITDLPATAEPATIKAFFAAWDFPAPLHAQIDHCHSLLQAQRSTDLVYAVRSSATAEDLGDASFAGQHDTFYYVTYGELLPMIKQCWASLWSPQALAYRNTQGIDHRSVLMAVVVQEMIPSDISGITFTSNPLTGNTNEIVSDATWGMGAAIVDGRVTPDHYVVQRHDKQILIQRIADKANLVSTTRPAEGQRMTAVPQHLRRTSCLSAAQIMTVTDWALKAETHFGAPQDLEWAFHADNYYMLQSRPITTLTNPLTHEVPETRKLVLFKSMAENFTEPLLPLTVDVFRNVTDFYQGRAYQPVLVTKLLLPIKLTDEEAAMLQSLETPDNFAPRINWLMLPVSISLWFLFYLLFGVLAARSRRLPDDFMEQFRQRAEAIDAEPGLSPSTTVFRLFGSGAPLKPIGLGVIMVNITAATRYILLMGLLNKLIARWLPDTRHDAGSLLCSGSVGVKSTEMGRVIYQLAAVAKVQAKVRSVFRNNTPDDIYAALQAEPEAGDFLRELHLFLREHGHRALKEFELASPRFAENPAPVLAMIKNYMGIDADPQAMEQHTHNARTELIASMQAGLLPLPLEAKLAWRWRLLAYLADRTRHFVKLRENSRFYHIMAWNSARKKILQAEQTLLAAGKLKIKNDIFYLRWHEIRALLDNTLGWLDVEDTIRARRMQNIRWTNQGAQKLVNIVSTRQPRVVARDQLAGQGSSPGQYEGIARVIMDPSVDAELHPGEILVAPYTDPAWTPLFLIARAAVVGVGSYLSHAGTIAREYGMPCVVDVTDCTSRIRTGDRLLVDGTTGIVHLLAAEQPE
jgi:phosphohistidine swiveling domain-containing protein